MARLFVAVWPPPAVVRAIAAEVPRPPRPGVRWVPPQDWHVTLRFLGRAEPAEAVEALDRLVGVPVRASIGPAVTTLGRAVVCLPVGGLDDLAGAVRSATAGVGQPPDPRGFTGHLTLARRRGRAQVPTGSRFEAGFEVDEVALVASDTLPSGARYRVLQRWRLGS
jgi:RNA 2',3'-cyclic 3'-phosphodiesterase